MFMRVMHSTGKSTFFNAMLGEDCMPTGTVPETARICRIVHNPEIDQPTLKDGDQEITGGVSALEIHD